MFCDCFLSVNLFCLVKVGWGRGGGGESEEGEESKGKYSKFLLRNSGVPISSYSSGPVLNLYQCGFICCLCVEPLHLPAVAFFSLGKCAILIYEYAANFLSTISDS